jgi:hypothetical protein
VAERLEPLPANRPLYEDAYGRYIQLYETLAPRFQADFE